MHRPTPESRSKMLVVRLGVLPTPAADNIECLLDWATRKRLESCQARCSRLPCPLTTMILDTQNQESRIPSAATSCCI